jgi:hypothetical protein
MREPQAIASRLMVTGSISMGWLPLESDVLQLVSGAVRMPLRSRK